jgi:high-affinity iron transporter
MGMSVSPTPENRPENGMYGTAVNPRRKHLLRCAVFLGGVLLIVAVTFWYGIAPAENSFLSAFKSGHTSAVLNVGVLVFREGLECVLVLAAITADRTRSARGYLRAVAAGAGVGFIATLMTWHFVVLILDDLGKNISALAVQAGTGLLAIVVLLVVMNWFFHKTYWTGWISVHTERKRKLLRSKDAKGVFVWGMGLLGFTSFYREGFEVVLFLQSYRLKSGSSAILDGVVLGSLLSGLVAVLTFVAHRRLPYRKMLVLTGVMLGFVLLVMVGEQTQEMQLAHWLPKTQIPSLARMTPDWMGLWFSVFPTVETLSAQLLAAVLVLGSYITAQPSQAAAR